MALWLLAFKLNDPGLAGNHYILAVLIPDPKEYGLTRTATAEHGFPTISAVTRFVATHCRPAEVSISDLASELGEHQIYVMKVCRESALKMGFNV
jgi:hypothetical protein